MSDTDTGNQGEGNREAARRYDKAARAFVDSGKVGQAASAAQPADKREAAELLAAEREGLAHSKGEALADRGSTLPTLEPAPERARDRAPGSGPA